MECIAYNMETFFITGNKIYLREVRQSDINQTYCQWLNDPEVNRYLETRFIPQSTESISQFVASKTGNNEMLLAICCAKNDCHIGNIKLGPINWVHRYGDVSLFIGDKNYWGKGIASEAIELLTDFAFRVLNMHRLKADAYDKNIGSIRAFEKCGYVREGILRKQYYSDGKYVDTVLLGILQEEYQLPGIRGVS